MKKLKNIFSMLMAIAILITGITITPVKAKAATAVSNVPITCYTLDGKVTTYTSKALSKSTGYIASGDLCRILAVYSNGTVKVSYPVKNGTKTAYAESSKFFKNTTFSTVTKKLGVNKKAYTRATGTSSIGTVYASDNVIIIGNNGSRTQIVYPISGGYKAGWVDGVYTLNSSPSNNSNTQTVLSDAELKELTFDYRFYANEYGDLKAAFGYNEAQLYNHFIQHGISEGRRGSALFDVKYYLNTNADLLKAYGSGNYAGAYTHFKYYGFKELRKFSEYFDAAYYKNVHSDLKNMSNKDRLFHYVRWGLSEKRTANSQGKMPNTNQNVSPNINSSTGYVINGVNIGYKAGDYFTDNGRACTDHGKQGIHSYYNESACNCICTYKGKSLGAVQCFGFARYVQTKLYGVNSYSSPNNFYKLSNSYVAAGKLTTSKLKNLVQSAGVGAHIRTNGSKHSMIITEVTNTGFSIIQCNGSNNKEYSGHAACRIGTYTYTWSSYVSSTYGQRGLEYIEKIK